MGMKEFTTKLEPPEMDSTGYWYEGLTAQEIDDLRAGLLFPIMPSDAGIIKKWNELLVRHNIVGVLEIDDEADMHPTSVVNPAAGEKYTRVWTGRELQMCAHRGQTLYGPGSRIFSLAQVVISHVPLPFNLSFYPLPFI